VGKYDALRQRLSATRETTVTMSLAEMDELVGGLPASARTHRAWWANERARAHVQAEAWTSAGFAVSAVDGDRVVFTRTTPRPTRLEVVGISGDTTTVSGAIDLVDGVVVADEGGRWLIDEFTAVLPDGSNPRRVRPEHGLAFLVGCWASLRGTYAWGELVAADGRRLTREEGIALAEELAGIGDRDAVTG
jgi:hypothetical protein